MRLVISGDVPSQKNSKEIAVNRRTGQRFVRSNDRVLSWKKEAVTQLKEQFKGFEVTDYPISLSLVFFWSNHRRHDLDNGAAGVLDSLTSAGVIEDDNVKFVECVTLQYGGCDKENPRCEVFIDE